MKHAGRITALATLAALAFGIGQAAQAQHQHGSHDDKSHSGKIDDRRQLVKFPEVIRSHTLANMRDHLLVLGEIQEALSKGWFDKAADISEKRLGMSSLGAHGAHESSKYMPKGMQDVGTSMHHNASRFAVEAQNAAVTNDLRPALRALADVTQSCVACHAAYRLH